MIDFLIHPENQYSPPTFQRTPTLRVSLDVFNALVEQSPAHNTQKRSFASKELALSDSSIGHLSLEQFIEKFEAERDRLDERKLRGKKLTKIEQYNLTFLNQKLDELLDLEQPRRHRESIEILNNAKRFIAQNRL